MKIPLKYRLIFIFLFLPCLLPGQQVSKTKTPPPPVNYLKLGNDFFSKANYKMALDSFGQFLKDSSETAEVSFILGRTHLKLGNFEQGMEYLNKAASSNVQFKEYLLKLNYNEIPFSFVRSNFMGDKLIDKISNGFYLSPLYSYSVISSRVIDDASEMPLWNSQVELPGYGAELSFNYNPLTVSFDFQKARGSFRNAVTRFALPPSLPGKDAAVNTDISLTSLSGSLSYTPAVLFWGSVYPYFGASYVMNRYKNQIAKSYSIICLDAGLLIKYKALFIKGDYKQPLDNTAFEYQAQVQAGILINFLN